MKLDFVEAVLAFLFVLGITMTAFTFLTATFHVAGVTVNEHREAPAPERPL